jgi:hypothetical protein
MGAGTSGVSASQLLFFISDPSGTNKLMCFSLTSLLRSNSPEPNRAGFLTERPLKGSWPNMQILDYPSKACHQHSSLFSWALVRKKKSFVTFTLLRLILFLPLSKASQSWPKIGLAFWRIPRNKRNKTNNSICFKVNLHCAVLTTLLLCKNTSNASWHFRVLTRLRF